MQTPSNVKQEIPQLKYKLCEEQLTLILFLWTYHPWIPIDAFLFL